MNGMTLLDWIAFGIIKSHAQAEQAAHGIIDLWHADRIPGKLEDVLGLSAREYQAWTTGGVSLLTIAAWKQTGPPDLDRSKPWFRISGRPGREKIGYLDELSEQSRSGPTRRNGPTPHGSRAGTRARRSRVSRK